MPRLPDLSALQVLCSGGAERIHIAMCRTFHFLDDSLAQAAHMDQIFRELEEKEKAHRIGMDGVIVINKPAGLTSSAVVLAVNACWVRAKVGHTGSLTRWQPALPLCINEEEQSWRPFFCKRKSMSQPCGWALKPIPRTVRAPSSGNRGNSA